MDALVDRGKLNRVEVNGEAVYRTVKSAKKAAQSISRMEEIFHVIQEAGDTGIITSQLRDFKFCGNELLDEALKELVRLGRIYCIEGERACSKRYFVTKNSIIPV